MLCAYGPIILGYVEPEINDAVKRRMDLGLCFSLVQPIQNELEERLASTLPAASDDDRQDRLRRDQRRRARGACLHRPRRHRPLRLSRLGDRASRPRRRAAGRRRPDRVRYGDVADLERVFAENPDKVATIIITPVGHPRRARRGAAEGYLEKVKELTHKNGAVLIFDEIRTGFRVAMGGAQQRTA